MSNTELILVGKSDFYCQTKCGEEDFSIDEWNEAFLMCCKMGVSEKEMSYILDGEPCKTQCDDCINIFLDRKTKEILNT